jgi:hypothetical protein
MGQACDVRIADDCGNGVWYQNLTCMAAPCAPPPPPPGACCAQTHCTIADDAASCVGQFMGAATACGPSQNPTTCCPANFNHTSGVSVQDIFDFLAAYFSGAAGGDFNGNGLVSVQDIFDFLSAYFAGCG